MAIQPAWRHILLVPLPDQPGQMLHRYRLLVSQVMLLPRICLQSPIFEKQAHVPAERDVAGVLRAAAVIAREEDQRLFIQLSILELLEDAVNASS